MSSRRIEVNFVFLFIGLVVVLIADPIVSMVLGRHFDRLLGLMIAVLLLVGVWSLQLSRVWFRVGLLLACVGLMVGFAATFTGNFSLELLGRAIASPAAESR